ncbi:hypothetical protein QZH41_020207, partial [Actinostola sp. cb2023]
LNWQHYSSSMHSVVFCRGDSDTCGEVIRLSRTGYHLHRVHCMKQLSVPTYYQMLVWMNDRVYVVLVCHSQMAGIGWEKVGDEWILVITNQAPARQAIIQLVKCGC